MKPRNKKSKFSVWIIGRIIIFVFVGFISFLAYQKTEKFLKSSKLFTVKEVLYDPSLEFIRAKLVAGLVGRNLFAIDAGKIHRQLQLQYPQIANLRVVKRYPNQILIIAKQRVPYAQVKFGQDTVIVDKEGVALTVSLTVDKSLPLIAGLKNVKVKIALGRVIQDKNLWLALRLLKLFQKIPLLSKYRVVQIDISNPSQIYIFLLENLKIIVDNENVEQKLRSLGLLLSEGKLEINKIHYIDLRFKEPVLGKK